MLIVSSRFITDPSRAEPHRQAHIDWVERYVGEGLFLFAGPKADKSGGIILARGNDRDRLSAILGEDSWVQAGIVENEIVAFDAKFALPELVALSRN